jgi:Sigma 54 modulation protein / S30EA ribosomal protein
MKLPLQITFRNMKSSAMIEEWIQAEAAKLEKFYGQITACRVAIELPHRHHKKVKPLHVRIDLTLPGKEIVIKREPALSPTLRKLAEHDTVGKLHRLPPHHDLHLAIRDAFKTATRRIQDFARRRRGDVKTHEQSPAATVPRIFPGKGSRFLNAREERAG